MAPQGQQLPKIYFWLPLLFSLSALVLLFVGTACDFLEFTSTEPIVNPLTGESAPVELRFGFWYRSWTLDANSTNSTTAFAEDACTYYPPSVKADGTWSAARGLLLTAIILGGSLVMLDLFQGCVSTSRRGSLQFGAAGYLVCCVVTGLSLLLLDSDLCKNNALIEKLNQSDNIHFGEKCSLSKGGKSTIASTVLWFAAAAVTLLLAPLKEKERGRDGEGLHRPLFLEDDSTLL